MTQERRIFVGGERLIGPGAEVTFVDHPTQRGRILRTEVAPHSIVYVVGWWAGDEYRVGEFYSFELERAPVEAE